MKLYILIDSKILKSSRYSASLGCLKMFNSSLRDAFCSSKSPHSSPVVISNGNAVPIGLSQSFQRHGIFFLVYIFLVFFFLVFFFLVFFFLVFSFLVFFCLVFFLVFPASFRDFFRYFWKLGIA